MGCRAPAEERFSAPSVRLRAVSPSGARPQVKFRRVARSDNRSGRWLKRRQVRRGEKHLGEGTRLLRRAKMNCGLSIVFYGRGRRDFAGHVLKLPGDSREVRFVPKVAGLELKHSAREARRPDLSNNASRRASTNLLEQEVALGDW